MIALLLTCSKSPILREHSTSKEEPAQDISTYHNCAGCHVKEAAEWKRSKHAESWSNPIFQVSFAVTTFPRWCQSCHQPLLERPIGEQTRDTGVGCLTCHLEDGEILTSQPPSKSTGAPHALKYDADLGQSVFCAECHQFDLPEYHPMHSDVPVQNTYQEWLDSGFSEQCQDCHMNTYGHSFPGAHHQEFLKGAIDVSVRRTEDGVTVSLQSIQVGHALPTGDPFRRMQWRLCTDEDCSNIIMKRTFVIMHHGPKWHVAEDNRLLPNQKQEFSVDAPVSKLWWSLVYFFGDPYLEKHLKEEDIWMEIHKGTL